MHARIKFHAYSDIKVNTEIVSRMKKKDYQRFTLYPGNEGSKHHRQSTGGCGVPTKAALGARPRGAVLALGRGRRRRRARVCGYEVFAQGKERDWIGSKDIYTHVHVGGIKPRGVRAHLG
jgi:hypothetical protein